MLDTVSQIFILLVIAITLYLFVMMLKPLPRVTVIQKVNYNQPWRYIARVDKLPYPNNGRVQTASTGAQAQYVQGSVYLVGSNEQLAGQEFELILTLDGYKLKFNEHGEITYFWLNGYTIKQ